MRLVCISDTHGRHKHMSPIPDGDVLIHAGDGTGSGSLPQIDDFTNWFGLQPHSHKVLVGGNHEFSFDSSKRDYTWSVWVRDMCEKNGITYLQDEEVIIDGVKFFGSPWIPVFRQMAFNATEEDMEKHRALIPDDTEVLITHGPPLQL